VQSVSSTIKQQGKAAGSAFSKKEGIPFFKPIVQPKLTINPPNDIYEQEADAVADKIMRMTDNDTGQSNFFRPAVPAINRKCEHCEDEEKKMQRKEKNNEETAADAGLENYFSTLDQGGNPLSKEVRNFYEPRFGYDFSKVKVHSNSIDAKSAQSINAIAYTSGNHIVFNDGQYNPGTEPGKKLLAHELTHVVQQNTQSIQPKFIQRRVLVNPAAQTSYVASLLSFICGKGAVTYSGNTITSSCTMSSDTSCECVCDITSDPARLYTINVQPQSASPQSLQLWDGTTALVPLITPWPNTVGGANPTVTIHSPAGRNTEMGFFDDSERPVYYDDWRILAHELCGHGRLNQTYSGGTGNRAGHDTTIDTENTIAFEHGPYAMRGHFSNLKQGESFFNPIGNRSRIGFFQTNGLHYEAP